MNEIYLAIIVAFTTIASPLLLAYLTNSSRRKDKQQDWDRQDKVAVLLAKTNEDAAQAATIANGKLDVIHTLVNSSMTAALQSELDAITNGLILMKEVSRLHMTAGHRASSGSTTAIKATQKRIAELQVTLDERHRQAKVVEDQQHVAAAKLTAEQK